MHSAMLNVVALDGDSVTGGYERKYTTRSASWHPARTTLRVSGTCHYERF